MQHSGLAHVIQPAIEVQHPATNPCRIGDLALPLWRQIGDLFDDFLRVAADDLWSTKYWT
jgi:hypothetical protein